MAERLRKRPYIGWIAVFALAAIDVSGDPVGMLFEALPMLALYEAFTSFAAWLEA